MFSRKAKSLDGDAALGAAGEKAAEKFLKRAGVKILKRNYSCTAGEIDLIGLVGGVIVFFEVKTRRSAAAADPEENIHIHKQRQMQRVARFWLAKMKQPEAAYRFDAVSVVWPEGEEPEVRWIVEAFVPTF